MTVKLIANRKEKKHHLWLHQEQDLIWESIRGLWKNRNMNPVTYQRKLRDAADRRLL